MMPVNFEGAVVIGKPKDMTDEQCMSVWAKFGFGKLFQLSKSNPEVKIEIPPAVYAGVDMEDFPFYMTAWQPNKEDIEAINEGRPIFIKTLAQGLPPMAVFTLDKNNEGNF